MSGFRALYELHTNAPQIQTTRLCHGSLSHLT